MNPENEFKPFQPFKWFDRLTMSEFNSAHPEFIEG
jgi:hypothetical protein